jgi:hypothetical protein
MSLQSPWAKREDIPFSRTNKNTEDLNNMQYAKIGEVPEGGENFQTK